MKALIKKYMKSHWKCEDFGRGKSKLTKSRHRRTIKKKASREFEKDINKDS